MAVDEQCWCYDTVVLPHLQSQQFSTLKTAQLLNVKSSNVWVIYSVWSVQSL